MKVSPQSNSSSRPHIATSIGSWQELAAIQMFSFAEIIKVDDFYR